MLEYLPLKIGAKLSINSNHINELIQYAILVAGDTDDSFSSRLGPIHLVKYLYLADLANAKKCEGKTYTGLSWRFFNFGPWSPDAFNHIETAAAKINATIYRFASDYGDEDFLRFEKKDPYLLRDLERRIPVWITRNVRQDVKKYLNDTASLLNYVYATDPMLTAAPNELIDLSTILSPDEIREKTPLVEHSFSKSKQAKIGKEIKALKAKIADGAFKRKILINPEPSPVYDEIFQEGLRMLDTLDSSNFEENKITVSFDESVWRSDTRKGIYGR